MSTLQRTKKDQMATSQRLAQTKPPGWEIPLRDKFWNESFRDRSGEEGLICARPPLLFTDPYEDHGKEYLHNPRFKGVRFFCRHEKTGKEGLFSYITSFGQGAQYEPVDICMQRLTRQDRKKKGAISHNKDFSVPRLPKTPYKDSYLLEVDTNMPPDTIKNKISQREQERMSRINYLKSAPLSKRNPMTVPTNCGTYGCIGTTIGKIPEHMQDEYDLYRQHQRKEREENAKLTRGRVPFVSGPNTKPEGLFTNYRNTYGCDISFPEKPVEIVPKFNAPWKYSTPAQKGNSGYAKITIGKYPEYVVPGKKLNLPKDQKILHEWHSGGNQWWKPSPSIALFKMNVIRRR